MQLLIYAAWPFFLLQVHWLFLRISTVFIQWKCFMSMFTFILVTSCCTFSHSHTFTGTVCHCDAKLQNILYVERSMPCPWSLFRKGRKFLLMSMHIMICKPDTGPDTNLFDQSEFRQKKVCATLYRNCDHRTIETIEMPKAGSNATPSKLETTGSRVNTTLFQNCNHRND